MEEVKWKMCLGVQVFKFECDWLIDQRFQAWFRPCCCAGWKQRCSISDFEFL